MAQSVGNKFTERSKQIHRERAGNQTKNYCSKIAEYRYFFCDGSRFKGLDQVEDLKRM